MSAPPTNVTPGTMSSPPLGVTTTGRDSVTQVTRERPGGDPSQTRRRGWTASSWRILVDRQTRRLEEELQLATAGLEPGNATAATVQSSLDRARGVLVEPSTLATWLTGSLIDRAWAALDSARENLVLIEDPDRFRAHAGYFARLAAQVGSHASTTWDPALRQDRMAARELVLGAHIMNDQSHTAIRQFRNFLLVLTLMAAAGVVLAAILDSGDRAVLAVGALAGTAATVLPITTATALPGPYSLTTVQALLRIPSGALAALLGVVPATGNTALFYAVLFGVGQSVLLKLLDNQANSLVSASAPRTPSGMAPPGQPPKPAS
jgi:hypothetical protein